jgi:hypothetical protein
MTPGSVLLLEAMEDAKEMQARRGEGFVGSASWQYVVLGGRAA